MDSRLQTAAYNWAVNYIYAHGLPEETLKFWTTYKHSSFLSNIERNPNCLQRILDGETEPDEIDPIPWIEANQIYQFQLSIKDKEYETVALYECEKCNTTKNIIYKAQARSMDEGDTELILCVTCGHRWKNHN